MVSGHSRATAESRPHRGYVSCGWEEGREPVLADEGQPGLQVDRGVLGMESAAKSRHTSGKV